MAKTEDPAALRQRWRELAGADLPLDVESVFRATDGFGARRGNESRAKLLRELAPLLSAVLEPDEVLRYAARGFLYSAAEFLLSGHLAARHTNQMALVLTDRRLFWIQVDSRGRPRDLKNQLRLEKVRRATSRWTGVLLVETVSREKLVFNSVARADRNALASLIPGSPAAPREKAPSVEHLCPACARVVPGPVGSAERCPNPACRIPFRSPRKAAWLSAFVPGVGDIYLRHFAFGALEFVGSVLVLCIALSGIVVAVVTRDPETVVVAGVLGVLLVLLPRLFDFALTLHMARKGIVPLSLSPAPAGVEEGAPIGPSRARSLPAFPIWSQVLFALGAAAVVATGWISFGAAVRTTRVLEACRMAEGGKIAEATRLFDSLNAEKPVVASDRGRFALALWQGGDLDGGDRIVGELGPVEQSVADSLNAFVARHEEATKAHEEGRKALLEGRTEEAWPHVDRAVAHFATLETAPVPKNRYDVVVELAGDLLSPPVRPEDLDDGARLAELAGTFPGADARLDAARLRVRAGGGDAAGAEALATRLDTTTLDARWRLLALEARFVVATGEADRAALAAQAEAVTLDDVRRLDGSIRDNARARRGALMLLGGRGASVPAADLELARAVADGLAGPYSGSP